MFLRRNPLPLMVLALVLAHPPGAAAGNAAAGEKAYQMHCIACHSPVK
ncbi:MAG: hypothetical protein JNK75_01975, partial [Betaproteobacteria bacterium]|nr:hypothetical protein [Betaproteobacteria bacterium]